MIHLPKTLLGMRKVSLADRLTLPKLPGVYFLFYKNNLVYIGSSENVRERWRRHNQIPRCRSQKDAYLRWTPVDMAVLLETEQAYLDHFNPPWNKDTACAKRIRDLYKTADRQIEKSIARQIRRNAVKNGYRPVPCPSTLAFRPDTPREQRQGLRNLQLICKYGSWEFNEWGLSRDVILTEALCADTGIDYARERYLHARPDDSSGLYLDKKK